MVDETGSRRGFMMKLILAAGAARAGAKPAAAASSAADLGDEGHLPDLGAAVAWLNSAALNGKSLRGKVAVINFWTYSCINSLRALPYTKAWSAKYRESGLVVIGVHTPEFGFEKDRLM